MLKVIGVFLAFWLGYVAASYNLFSQFLQEKAILYVLLSITLLFLVIFIPLERIAQYEANENPLATSRTSAREQLQRRGSF
ncbi:hypothetical protein K501DRAFT_206287 [Backusella circina FSU 941]|nr:hypothetical protein K501DRAFT_206287 [Backusella circina FSU 941]